MRICCVSIDLPGHLDWGGYLATARVLKRRGHEVTWLSGQAVGDLVTGAGIAFWPLKATGWRHDMPPLAPDLPPAHRQAVRQGRALAVWLSPYHVLAAVAEIEVAIQALKPDVIISEPFAAAGALAAERAHLPFVVVGRPALPRLEGATSASNATAAIVDLCQQTGVDGAYWDRERGLPRSPWLHIDFFCRRWYADVPDIATQTHFFGGQPWEQRPLPTELSSDNPLVLITLGSTYARDETFFRLAAEAVRRAGALPLLATGRRAPQTLAALRRNPPIASLIRDWIDFSLIFPRLAAVIHHGGMATTHAAVTHAVPQIVVPHAGDQIPQAARVTQAGVGYGIRPKDFTPQTADRLVATILTDTGMGRAAERLAQDMWELGGQRASPWPSNAPFKAPRRIAHNSFYLAQPARFAC